MSRIISDSTSDESKDYSSSLDLCTLMLLNTSLRVMPKRSFASSTMALGCIVGFSRFIFETKSATSCRRA